MSVPSQGRRVLAIGLDAADHALVTRWRADGKLPQIDALMGAGATGMLRGADGYTAETPWTVFFSGCWPSTTSYWSPAKYHPDYRIEAALAYPFDGCGLFYDYAGSKTVIGLDLPQIRLSPKVAGAQILAWGAHSPQGPSQSLPGSLLGEFTAKYGAHPTFLADDFLIGESEEQAAALEAGLLTGIERRTHAALDMMAEKPWDLFLVVYGETHSAGHGFWHMSQPDHPLYPAYQPRTHDPLLAIYQALDAAVGRLRAAAPPGTAIVLFSAEGMKSNSADVPSWLFLPELLYRMNFPQRAALAQGEPGAALPPLARQTDRDWMRAVWALSECKNPVTRFVRRHTRLRLSRAIERLFPEAGGLRHPLDTPAYPYMPGLWYQPHWPEMTAFALPSFSEGNIRINVSGREKTGRVAPADFNRHCDAIIAEVAALKNPRNAKPILRDVLRQRTDPFGNPTGPDADLIFLWEAEPADVVDHPVHGRIGPVPLRRSGDHHGQGFFSVTGDGVARGALKPGALVDLAPTILDLLGAPLPNHFDGQSRLPELLREGALV